MRIGGLVRFRLTLKGFLVRTPGLGNSLAVRESRSRLTITIRKHRLGTRRSTAAELTASESSAPALGSAPEKSTWQFRLLFAYTGTRVQPSTNSALRLHDPLQEMR